MNVTNTPATERGEVPVQEEPFQSQSRDSGTLAKRSGWFKLIPRSLAEVGLFAVALLVISLQLKYLLDVSTEVPNQDDWNFLGNMFRSFDTHRIGAWVFDSSNGHFVVPGALAYLFSSHYLSLDLSPLRLLNFPICLAALFLTAHVINVEVRPRFLRFYLHLGACFIVFNLCFWEHFALGCGFSAILSTLFGGIGLYYIAKGTQALPKRKRALLVGLVFLFASVLSLGAGYAATAAAIVLFALSGLKKQGAWRSILNYETVVYGVACGLGLLAIVSHPYFHFTGRIIKAVYHTMLVAGSTASSFLDKNSVTAQNVAFTCGTILLLASFWIVFHFLNNQTRTRLLSVFSLALVLFGLFGCVAVAIARAYLPNGEFLNSRYTLYPSLCLLGFLLYSASTKMFLLTHTWCFLAACYLLTTGREQQIGFYRQQLFQKMEIAIKDSDNLSDEQLRAALYWRENTKGVRRVIARMRRDRVNLFRSSPNPGNGPH